MTVQLPYLPNNWEWVGSAWTRVPGGRQYTIEAKYILADDVTSYSEVTIYNFDSVQEIKDKFDKALKRVAENAAKIPDREEEDLIINEYRAAIRPTF